MIHMTLDYVIPTQSSVLQTIHCNVGLQCFYSILPKYLFVIIAMYAYFIDILHGSVKTHLCVVKSIIITLSQIVYRVCQ